MNFNLSDPAFLAACRPTGGFDPLSISGCVLCLMSDGDVYTTGTTQATDGQQVSTWVDASGNGNDATGLGAIKPMFEVNVLNGLPVVTTNGTHSYMSGLVSLASTGLTVFVVGTTGSVGSAYGRLLALENASGGDYAATDACAAVTLNGTQLITTFRNNNIPGNIPTTDGTFFVATVAYNGARGLIRKNGTGQLSMSSSGSFAITKYALSAKTDGSSLAGALKFAAILVYDSALGTTAREYIEDGLGAWAGITITRPAISLITGIIADTPRNNYGGYVGFRFTVGDADLVVTHLSRWKIAGNSGTHTIEIRDSGGTVVATAALDMTPGVSGDFNSIALAAAAILSAGGTYYLISLESNGGDFWHDDVSGGNITPTSDITVTHSVYIVGAGVPTSANAGVHSYSRPSLKYHL